MQNDNIEKLIVLLKARLHSAGTAKSSDQFGNVVYVDCDVYSVEMLVSFLQLSLSSFNQTPYFTFFTFDDDKFVNLFSEILVEGAAIYALSSKALIERGREFTMIDNGITFYPPSISEMLNTQYQGLLSHHWDKLKTIKSKKIKISFESDE